MKLCILFATLAVMPGCTQQELDSFGMSWMHDNGDTTIQILSGKPADITNLVVAHEFGHALRIFWQNGAPPCDGSSCWHSTNERDLMYTHPAMVNGSPINAAITAEDVALYTGGPASYVVRIDPNVPSHIVDAVYLAATQWSNALPVSFDVQVGDCIHWANTICLYSTDDELMGAEP